MREGVLGQKELKPRALGILAVDVGVPNMVIKFSFKFRLYRVELMFQYGELYGYVVLPPDALLIADDSVGATADNVAQVLSHSHHLHG